MQFWQVYLMRKYDVLQKLFQLYCFDSTRFVYMYPVKENDMWTGKYSKGNGSITFADLRSHIERKKTICVYAREKDTKFMCFDVDESDPTHVKLLLDKLESFGIRRDRVYISMSGKKGYHIDVFFDCPVWKTRIEEFFQYLRKDPEIAGIDMEIRPINNTNIKMPLGMNFRTGMCCWYVDRETLEPITNFEYVLDIQPISGAWFDEMVHRLNSESFNDNLAKLKADRQPTTHRRERAFSKSGEPVLRQRGQRHEMMLKRAIYVRRMGATEGEIYDELMDWVSRQDRSLIRSTDKEIEDDALRIASDVFQRYEVAARKGPVAYQKTDRIFKSDIDLVWRAGSKVARKVMMLFISYYNRYGKCIIGHERIAKIIGSSERRVFDLVRELEKTGLVIRKSTGGVGIRNGQRMLLANEYEIVSCERNGDSVPYSIEDVDSNFDAFYYGTLMALCDQKELKEHLTRTEVRKIMESGIDDD